MNRNTQNAVAALTMSTCGVALGQVEFYSNTKNRNYVQTSADQPVTPAFYSYVNSLFASNGSLTLANTGNAEVLRPDGVSVTLDDSFGVFLSEFGGFFATEAELDAALPAGEYIYSIAGGNFGEQQGSLVQPDTNLWNDVPYVSNYTEVVGAVEGQDLFVDFNDWTPDASTTPDRSAIFWGLFNVTTNTSVAGGVIGTSEASEFLVDGSLMTAGEYRLSLIFSARVDEFNVGFDGGANSTISFDTLTDLTFTVIPTPGAIGLLALAGLTTARRRR